MNYEILNKIYDNYKRSGKFKTFINTHFDDVTDIISIDPIYREFENYIYSKDDIYEYSNFFEDVKKATINLTNEDFKSFFINIINKDPKSDNIYKKLMKNINENLRKFDIDKKYYNMNRDELNKICDDLLINDNVFEMVKIRNFIKSNFIINFEDYITENLSWSKKILKDNRKDETDKSFLRIQKMCEATPGYVGIITFFHFNKKITLSKLQRLHKDIVELKSLLRLLPHHVVEYTDFEELTDDLEKLKRIKISKKYLKDYPPKVKNMIKDNQEFINIINDLDVLFKNKNDIRDYYFNNFLKKISSYNDPYTFLKALNNMFLDVGRGKYVKQIKNSQYSHLLYENENIVVFKVGSFNEVDLLCPNANWCIRRELSYYISYIESDDDMLLGIRDFSKKESNNFSIVGFVYSKSSYGGYSKSSKFSYNTGHAKDDSYLDESQIKQILQDNDADIYELLEKASEFSNEYISEEDRETSRY